MKLVINIPCYNEEQTLPLVLGELPEHIFGISEIRVQIVDDGSTDDTSKVGARFGCKVIRHDRNLGLGCAFQTGVNEALDSGVDIFVNIDADNQYPPRYIGDLIKPILENRAEIVIGDRQPWKVRYFSPLKRILQWLGNAVIKLLLNIDSRDAVSGFRAYSKIALEKMYVTSSYSYTLDTLVQAAHKNFRISSLKIQTNPPTRQSRLSRNIFQYLALTMINFIQSILIYEPRKVFEWSLILLFFCVLITFLLFLNV